MQDPLTTKTAEQKKKSSSLEHLAMLGLALLIAIGAVVRFIDLSDAEYNIDETYTSQIISGFQAEEVRDLLDGKKIQFGELCSKYQGTTAGRTINDSLHVVMSSQFPHSPIYDAAAYYWAHMLDAKRGTLRILAASFSLLLLPSMFWLGMELFSSPLMSMWLVAFTAISPVQIWFARENTEFALYAAASALANAAFLRACRTQSPLWWAVYALLLTLSFYVTTCMVFVLLVHSVCIFLSEKPKSSGGTVSLSRNLSLFLLASICIFSCAISPILLRLINAAITQLSWMWTIAPSPLAGTAENVISPLLWTGDFQFPLGVKLLVLPIPLLCLYYCWRRGKGNERNLLCLSVVLPWLIMCAPLTGGEQSAIVKYVMPITVAWTAVMAGCLGELMAMKRLRPVIVPIVAVLIALQLVSTVSVIRVHSHMLNDRSAQLISQVLAKESNNLVISQEGPGKMNIFHLLRLSHVVNPKSELLWFNHVPDSLDLAESNSTFYLFMAPTTLTDLVGSYGFRMTPQEEGAWYFLKCEPENR